MKQGESREKLFYSIGEVARIVGLKPHVLRFWETEFPQLNPDKDRSGQRVYRQKDIEMLKRIKKLLHEEQYTIAGAKKKLDNATPSGDQSYPREELIEDLKFILAVLKD